MHICIYAFLQLNLHNTNVEGNIYLLFSQCYHYLFERDERMTNCIIPYDPKYCPSDKVFFFFNFTADAALEYFIIWVIVHS